MLKANETWGVVELGYRYPDKDSHTTGKIKLISFQNFCPYEIDLEFFKDVRKEFNVHEWIDIILGAMDYNAAGYEDEHQKMATSPGAAAFLCAAPSDSLGGTAFRAVRRGEYTGTESGYNRFAPYMGTPHRRRIAL